MAKKQKVSAEETLKKIAVLLVDAGITAETEASDESADEATETDEPTEVDLPDSPEGIKKLSAEEATTLAGNLGLEIDGLNAKQITNLLLSVNKLTSDEELTEKEANALAKAVGAKPGKTVEKTVAALKEYFVADESEESDDEESSEEESDDEESSDDDEESEESDEESDDEESDEEESDDEEKSDDDDEESEESDDEEESDDDEKSDDDEEESDDEESEESDDEESEEVSEDDTLKAYNKVAKKKLKKFDALKDLLTDDEGDVADWGVPYSKNEEVFCCGMPLKDVKIKQGKKTVDGGKCQVTGKQFVQDSDGNFEEVE